MESVNVLLMTWIGDESQGYASSKGDEIKKQITSISPKIKLTDAADLFRAERSGDSVAKAELDARLAEVEVIYGLRFPRDVIARAPRLKWMQTMSAGVNWHLDNIAGLRESPVILTSVSGIHATPISEFVFELMLMFVKQAPLCFQQKQSKQWQRYTPTVLRFKTVGIVGLGNIGREIARLAKAFGMKVMATRRSAKRVTRARYVDTVFPRQQLGELLSGSDFVVIALPLTSETNRLIGEKELRAMKPNAYLINIGRGGIVDEEALIRALDEKWVAGAGLDVFATEPLPTDSRLWELPNVIFSPHVAGSMEDYNLKATELFCENLKRYLNGKRLLNVVNKKRGY